MTRQLTASLATDHALLSIAVPVREDTGRWFQVGEPTYTVEGDPVAECELLRTFGQTVLEELTDRLWDDGTLTDRGD